ncbi:hypothetical protein KBB96_19580 [Luteolibacter ambystomatis]|uniref:Lipoprotein n=1 Tax=Luteolibacter ambystomatis TaxID=2824561 RepID=A0A975IZC4_9BACT|nr:hypothetical protein [Luteolibacter ambystomatis]QUE51044.1 hypothetical protein KBB96_19580 [Luteolibacter ambystomatis]
MKLRSWLPFAGLLAALALTSCGKKETSGAAEEKSAAPAAVAKAEAPPKPNLDLPPGATPPESADEVMPDEEEPSMPDNEITQPVAEPSTPAPAQGGNAPAEHAPAKTKKKPK